MATYSALNSVVYVGPFSHTTTTPALNYTVPSGHFLILTVTVGTSVGFLVATNNFCSFRINGMTVVYVESSWQSSTTIYLHRNSAGHTQRVENIQSQILTQSGIYVTSGQTITSQAGNPLHSSISVFGALFKNAI